MIMRTVLAKPIILLGVAVLVLSACNSRLNPVNWFGNSREVVDAETGEVNPLVPDRAGLGLFRGSDAVYPGVPIDQVTDLRIERTRSGAIIVAEGIAARQGPFEVRLIPANIDEEPVDGVLTYSFDIVYPNFTTAIGPESTRRITAARSIGNDVLERTRVVRVVGARNARESRR